MADQDHINATDEQARRLLELALTFINADGPLSSSQIHDLYYPNVSKESFRKVFIRDREKLALCGLVIRRINTQPYEPLWQVDDRLSYADAHSIDPSEALALDVACTPLVSDPSFPYADDLRQALGKVDSCFDSGSVARVSRDASSRPKVLSTAERCASLRHAVSATYRKADDTEIERTIALYGFFVLRNSTYVVGPCITERGELLPGSIRTYRVDRFVSMKECKRIPYVIPADFDIKDYVLLPFELGETRYYASFAVPNDMVSELRDVVRGRGTISRQGSRYCWKVAVSSEAAAAAWAIAYGLEPLEPESLVEEWKSRLRRAL